MILVDTNLLCRLANRAHSHSAIARNALSKLRAQGEEFAVLPQNIYEFCSVATRSKGPLPTGLNGLGMSIFLTDKWLDYIQKRFVVLVEGGQLLNVVQPFVC